MGLLFRLLSVSNYRKSLVIELAGMLWELIFLSAKRKRSGFGKHPQGRIGMKLNKSNNDHYLLIFNNYKAKSI